MAKIFKLLLCAEIEDLACCIVCFSFRYSLHTQVQFIDFFVSLLADCAGFNLEILPFYRKIQFFPFVQSLSKRGREKHVHGFVFLQQGLY